MVNVNPNSLEGKHYDRGNKHRRNCRFDEAIKCYNKAIDLKPDFYEAFHNRGRAYVLKDSYDEAISDYTQAINIKPNPYSFTNRGNAYGYKGLFDESIKDYNRALAIDPYHFDALTGRAASYSIIQVNTKKPLLTAILF